MEKKTFEVERPRQKEKRWSPLFCRWGCVSVPQRVVLAMICHLAFQNAFNLRVVLNVAITVMVEPAQPKNITDHACPELLEVRQVQSYGQTFDWPRSVEAMVLYAFYIGYVTSQIPGGYLADKFGARWVLFFSLSCSSVLTAIFPTLTSIAGYWVAVVIRFFLGIAQGPIMAAISTLVSHWIPQREQTLLGGIAYSGSNLGTVVGGIVTGVIIQSFNSWHAAFYFWSFISCIYLVLHLVYLYSYTSTHKHICPEELAFIEEEVVKTEKLVVPWKKIMTNVPYLANISGQFGHNFIHFILSTCLPLYMKEILAFNIQSNALFSAMPFFFMWICSLLYSMIAGWLRRNQLVTSRLLTGLFGPFSNIGAAICVLAAVYAGCSRQTSVILYTLGMIIKPFFYCTISVNVNELSKNYGGTLFAIANTVATVGGIFGNWLVGYLTSDGKLSQWKMVFWINLVIAVVTSVTFAIFASSKRQEFDYQSHEYQRAPDKEKHEYES